MHLDLLRVCKLILWAKPVHGPLFQRAMCSVEKLIIIKIHSIESSITNYHNRVQPNIFYCIVFILHAARWNNGVWTELARWVYRLYGGLSSAKIAEYSKTLISTSATSFFFQNPMGDFKKFTIHMVSLGIFCKNPGHLVSRQKPSLPQDIKWKVQKIIRGVLQRNCGTWLKKSYALFCILILWKVKSEGFFSGLKIWKMKSEGLAPQFENMEDKIRGVPFTTEFY